jgi:sugar/nucleoside kinase (ribokinase family)
MGSERLPRVRGSFVGLTTVDIIFGVTTYPVEDTKNTARQYTAAAGGPASNAAVVFSYLGGEARLLSRLGKSSIAAIARSDLARYGVTHIDLDPLSETDPPLSAIITSASHGSRTICTSPAIDDELPGIMCEESEIAFAVAADIVLLDGHQAKVASYFARQARQRGTIVVLDGDLCGPDIGDLLPLVDIVIFGRTFAIPQVQGIRGAFEYLTSFGVKHVVATQGAGPIEFVSDDVWGTMEAEKATAVDTLAAGDFFHGAFCYSYCRNRDLQQALRFAARVAGSSVASFGTRQWMDNHEPTAFG